MGYESGVKWFFKVNWILGISPLYATNSEGSIRLRWFWPQLIFYFLFVLLQANYLITLLRVAVFVIPKTPAGYIWILYLLLNIAFQLDFQRIVWSKRDSLGKFARNVQAERPIVWQLGFNRFKVELLSVAVCVLNVVIGILAALREILMYFGGKFATQNQIIAYHTPMGMYKLFALSELPQFSNTSTPESEDIILSWSELGFCAFSMIQDGIGTLQGYTGEYFVFVAVITMWACVDQFEKLAKQFCEAELKKNLGSDLSETVFVVSAQLPEVNFAREMRFKEFCQEFTKLQELFVHGNDIFGSLVFHYIIMSATFYATALSFVSHTDGFISILLQIYPLLLCCTLLLLSANIGTKMNRVKEFLLIAQEDHKLFPVEQFSNLIRRIKRKSVAVSAYSCFTVDYNVLFNVVTTTMTYLLIIAEEGKEALNERR